MTHLGHGEAPDRIHQILEKDSLREGCWQAQRRSDNPHAKEQTEALHVEGDQVDNPGAPKGLDLACLDGEFEARRLCQLPIRR